MADAVSPIARRLGWRAGGLEAQEARIRGYSEVVSVTIFHHIVQTYSFVVPGWVDTAQPVCMPALLHTTACMLSSSSTTTGSR